MKLYRPTDKNLIFHIKGITWSENKNIYFEIAFEINHRSNLLKVNRKTVFFFDR